MGIFDEDENEIAENIKKEAKEQQMEEDFFTDNDKANNAKLLISAGIVLLVLAAVLSVLFFKYGNKLTADREEVKVENSYHTDNVEKPVPTSNLKEDIGGSTVIESRDEEPSPTAMPTPTEEPVPTPTPDVPVMELDVKDYSKVKFDIRKNLSEMERYFKENNTEALYDLANLDRFIAMSYSYKDTDNFAYYGDTDSNNKPNGKGVAVYADNRYYYGDWKNGKRDGNGVWVHYHIHLKTNLTDMIVFHQYSGEFRNDFPEGEGQDHYEYDSNFFVKDKWYITNYIGNFKKGLIDGEIYCTATNKNNDYIDYNGEAKNGMFIPISESIDKQKRIPVLTETKNPDNYYWIPKVENINIGVSSYVSGK